MKEIGGYFGLETALGNSYYPEAFALNLGRTAISWYCKQKGFQTLYLPAFLCRSVPDYLAREGFTLRFYHIDEKLKPILPDELKGKTLSQDACLFLNNAYGQLKNEEIVNYQSQLKNILLDNTHAFFQRPPQGVPCVCSVRKFFGVPDGAYLITEDTLPLPKAQDRSAKRFPHLLGRIEDGAAAHYQEMLSLADTYHLASPKRMSALTETLLTGIDYAAVIERRRENYYSLHTRLADKNPLTDRFAIPGDAPFVYPFLVKDGPQVRAALATMNIYIPTYWKELFDDAFCSQLEQHYARDILALPVDQRYSEEDMNMLADALTSCMRE